MTQWLLAGALAAPAPSQVKAGWVGLIVLVLLLVATFLLVWNMNSRLKKIKVPYRHELEQADREERAGDSPDDDPDATGGPPAR